MRAAAASKTRSLSFRALGIVLPGGTVTPQNHSRSQGQEISSEATAGAFSPSVASAQAASMALRVAVLVSAVRVVAGSGCGLAEDFPAADEIFWSKGEEGSTSGQCLSKAMQMSYLDQRYRDAVRATDSGGALRMLVKNWDSHIFNSAILTILLEEVLGYPPPTHCTTNTGFTAGSFDLLSEMSAGRPAEVDIDMELWASSSFPEYQDATGRYSNAGSTFSYGRSGLFLRPGGTEAQREMLVSLGRSYNNLERDVLPLLPTLAQAQQLSIWCNSDIGSGAHCKEVPNRACFDIAASDGSILDRCRVLFKSYNSADAGLVETMIQNSSLPLVIVYTGDSKGFDYLDEMPNQTVLFYHWEPALVIAPDTNITRVVFDDPVFCEPDQSFSALPPTRACDFRLGLVRSRRAQELGGASCSHCHATRCRCTRVTRRASSSFIPILHTSLTTTMCRLLTYLLQRRRSTNPKTRTGPSPAIGSLPTRTCGKGGCSSHTSPCRGGRSTSLA